MKRRNFITGLLGLPFLTCFRGKKDTSPSYEIGKTGIVDNNTQVFYSNNGINWYIPEKLPDDFWKNCKADVNGKSSFFEYYRLKEASHAIAMRR